jgi:hypothetical protein
MRYEVIESRRWNNAKTGATASLYGAVPWTSEAGRVDWAIETVGYTWRDTVKGTIGIGRVPAKTIEEAEEVAAKLNALHAR